MAAHTCQDAIFVACHIGNGFKRAAVLYTNTHVEDIKVVNGQKDPTKAKLEKDSSLKVVTQPNFTNLLHASPDHWWLPECVALHGVSIWEQAVWFAFPGLWTRNLNGRVVWLSFKDSTAHKGHQLNKMFGLTVLNYNIMSTPQK